MKTRKIIAAVATAAVAASCVAVTAGAYNAYIGFMTVPYSFRNAYDDTTYGIDSGYFDNAIVWGGNDSTTFPDYADSFDWDIEGYVLDVDYTDAEVNYDGTYTVAIDGFDWALDGSDGFNLIFISTDIPYDSGAVVTSASIIVDGNVTATIENPIIEQNIPNIRVNLVNIWNPDVDTYTGAYPTESLAVEFTVEGLGAAPAADADTGADTDADTDASAPVATNDKTSPDTGVEGVAVVAGAAIVAGGVLLLSKKRK